MDVGSRATHGAVAEVVGGSSPDRRAIVSKVHSGHIGATLGFVNLPGPPIEAAIALSIVFVAAEILRSRQEIAGLTERYPWFVAFIFGLLHGFGFAGANRPAADVDPPGVAFFNAGVEIGQLLFIAGVFALVALARRIPRPMDLTPPEWARAVPPYVIGSLAAFWTFQRLAAF